MARILQRRQSCRMPSSSASPLLPIVRSSSSSSSSFSSSLRRRHSPRRPLRRCRRRRFLAVAKEFFHHSIILGDSLREDHPVRIGLSNEAIPRDLDGRRPGSWRWFSSQMTLWCDGGGIDIDYCAFPTCPGNPRGIVSAPALCFCMLLPPLSSPTLSTSHRQLLARAVSPSVCLSRFLSLSPLLLPLLLHPSLFLSAFLST